MKNTRAGILSMLLTRKFHIEDTLRGLSEKRIGTHYKVDYGCVFLELHSTVQATITAHLREELAEIKQEIKNVEAQS